MALIEPFFGGVKTTRLFLTCLHVGRGGVPGQLGVVAEAAKPGIADGPFNISSLMFLEM